MIIAGYPGIGKSTLVKESKGENLIDLESSLFSQSGQNWENSYVRVAISLSKQGYNVLVSTDKEVLRLLNGSEKIILIYPDHLLKDEWVHKLLDRALKTEEPKDVKAFERAFKCYRDDISHLNGYGVFGAYCYVIRDMNYVLKDIISKVLKENTYGI